MLNPCFVRQAGTSGFIFTNRLLSMGLHPWLCRLSSFRAFDYTCQVLNFKLLSFIEPDTNLKLETWNGLAFPVGAFHPIGQKSGILERNARHETVSEVENPILVIFAKFDVWLKRLFNFWLTCI